MGYKFTPQLFFSDAIVVTLFAADIRHNQLSDSDKAKRMEQLQKEVPHISDNAVAVAELLFVQQSMHHPVTPELQAAIAAEKKRRGL